MMAIGLLFARYAGRFLQVATAAGSSNPTETCAEIEISMNAECSDYRKPEKAVARSNKRFSER